MQDVVDKPVAEPASIYIPPGLLYRTGNRRMVRVPGQTVREVISGLDQEFHGLGFNLCYETGELRRFINIFVAGEDIRYMEGLETPVRPGSVVHIIHSVAGG